MSFANCLRDVPTLPHVRKNLGVEVRCIPRRPLRTVASTLIVACGTADQAATPPPAPAARTVAPASLDYTLEAIELPRGFTSGVTSDVNDAGLAVGAVDSESVSRGWFKRLGTAGVVLLPLHRRHDRRFPGNFAAAVSNGPVDGPVYVVGWTDTSGLSIGARWTITKGHASAPVLLDPKGLPVGINDAGTAVGGAHVWYLDGHSATVDAPDPFVTADLEDINSSGRLLCNAGGPGLIGRAHVRLGDGPTDAWVRLDPPAGTEAAATHGYALSEDTVVGGRRIVYVAGKVQVNDKEFHPLRWTVDLTAGTVTVERRNENGAGLGVNAAGDVTGTYGNRWNAHAFVWTRTGTFDTRPMPKELTNGKGESISPNGRYIAGQADADQAPRALFWTRQP